jgi:uncharacterized protein YlaN (UPF0358 family)
MKVYAVVGAGTFVDTVLPAPVFLGVYHSRKQALETLKREWERIQHCIEEGEEVEEEKRKYIDAQWNNLELPITMADEDVYDIFEWEMQDAATS